LFQNIIRVERGEDERRRTKEDDMGGVASGTESLNCDFAYED
jgi:hypothetical protein